MRRLLIGAALLGLCAFASAGGSGGYHVETKVALPDGGWDLVSFDPVMRRVYVARTDSVTAIDVDKGVASRLAPANRSHAAVPVNHGAEVMVTDGGTNTARFIDAKTGAEVASVKVGTAPDAALFDEHSGLALVMNAKSGDVSLIDPKTHALVGSIAVGGSLELAASDGAGRVFLNVEDKNELVVLDLKARSARHVALKGCDGPTGIAYLAVSHTVLSACGNGVATLTSARTLKVQRTIAIGKGPDTALYDPVRHRALVPCGRSGDLWIFSDTAKGVKPAGHVATQQGARTATLDPRTGKVYLPAAEYDPPVAPSTRPKMRPGTAVLVVVAP